MLIIHKWSSWPSWQYSKTLSEKLAQKTVCSVIYERPKVSIYFSYLFLQQVLTVWSWLAWNSPCRPGCTWSHKASCLWLLCAEIKGWTILPGPPFLFLLFFERRSHVAYDSLDFDMYLLGWFWTPGVSTSTFQIVALQVCAVIPVKISISMNTE